MILSIICNNRNPFIDNPQWADSIWETTVFAFINEITNEHSVSIYPNPATDFLFINKNLSFFSYEYQLFNSIGKLVNSGKPENNKIDISKLNAGIYFMQIRTDKGNFGGKFIKQ